MDVIESTAGGVVKVWPGVYGWWWSPGLSPGKGGGAGSDLGVVGPEERSLSEPSFFAFEEVGVGEGGSGGGSSGSDGMVDDDEEGVASGKGMEKDAGLGVETRKGGDGDVSRGGAGVVAGEEEKEYPGVDGDGDAGRLLEIGAMDAGVKAELEGEVGAETSLRGFPLETEVRLQGGVSGMAAREGEGRGDGEGPSFGGWGSDTAGKQDRPRGGDASSGRSKSGDGGSEAGAGGERGGRRLFLEFYGPVVGFFSAFGFPSWVAELLTVAATQICPLLCAAPLLRMSTRGVDSRGNAGNGNSRQSFLPCFCKGEGGGGMILLWYFLALPSTSTPPPPPPFCFFRSTE